MKKRSLKKTEIQNDTRKDMQKILGEEKRMLKKTDRKR